MKLNIIREDTKEYNDESIIQKNHFGIFQLMNLEQLDDMMDT